jgi:hypothetical protein
MARDWKPCQAPGPTSLTEIARRYHAAAVALAQTLGLSVAEVLSQHRESVTAIFIESGRCDLRLPAAVKLPPLNITDVETVGGKPPDEPVLDRHRWDLLAPPRSLACRPAESPSGGRMRRRFGTPMIGTQDA